MAYYDLSKSEREALFQTMQVQIERALTNKEWTALQRFAADEDTYIRKNVYLILGNLWLNNPNLCEAVLKSIAVLLRVKNPQVRQTAINAAGEVGKKDFESVAHIFDESLFDTHHVPRNAVIGSVKKMGAVNPDPVLHWARNYLHHPDKEVRREICHGIELRGRKYPLDILPLLKELQWDKTKRVSTTLVHVIGQIAYKKNCLEQVAEELLSWDNQQLVEDALAEIVNVHGRYKDFAFYTQAQALNKLLHFFPNAHKLNELANTIK